jgi:prevent-host-death family protein
MGATVNIHEAKTQFSKLLQRVLAGEEIIIAKAGTPVARLVPYAPQPRRRIPGSAKGKIWIAPDFNAPLPAELLDAFEGKVAES